MSYNILVKINGVDVSDFITEFALDFNYGNATATGTMTGIKKGIDLLVSFNNRAVVEIWRGWDTPTDRKEFKGYIEDYSADKTKYKFTLKDQLGLLTNLEVTKVYGSEDTPIQPSEIWKDIVYKGGINCDDTSVQSTSSVSSGLKSFRCTHSSRFERSQAIKNALGWQMYYKADTDLAYLEPAGYRNSKTVLSTETNVVGRPQWSEDKSALYNNVSIIGNSKEVQFLKKDPTDPSGAYTPTEAFTVTADGQVATFTLSQPPNKVTYAQMYVGGNYYLLNEGNSTSDTYGHYIVKKNQAIDNIVFYRRPATNDDAEGLAPKAGDVVDFQYTYLVPTAAVASDIQSQQVYGIRTKTINRKDIENISDAQLAANAYLSAHAYPIKNVNLKINQAKEIDVDIGERIDFYDTINGITAKGMVVSKYKINYPKKYDEVTLGPLNVLTADYTAGLDYRIHELESQELANNYIGSQAVNKGDYSSNQYGSISITTKSSTGTGNPWILGSTTAGILGASDYTFGYNGVFSTPFFTEAFSPSTVSGGNGGNTGGDTGGSGSTGSRPSISRIKIGKNSAITTSAQVVASDVTKRYIYGKLYDPSDTTLQLKGVCDAATICGLVGARGTDYYPSSTASCPVYYYSSGTTNKAIDVVTTSGGANVINVADIANFFYRYAKALQSIGLNYVRIGSHAAWGTDCLYTTWRYCEGLKVSDPTNYMANWYDYVILAMCMGFEAAELYYTLGPLAGFSDMYHWANGDRQIHRNRNLSTSMTSIGSYLNNDPNYATYSNSSDGSGFAHDVYTTRTDNILNNGSTSYTNFIDFAAYTCRLVAGMPHCVAVELYNEPDLSTHKYWWWGPKYNTNGDWSNTGPAAVAFKNWVNDTCTGIRNKLASDTYKWTVGTSTYTSSVYLTNGETPYDGGQVTDPSGTYTYPYWSGIQYLGSSSWTTLKDFIRNSGTGLDIVGIHSYHFSPEFMDGYTSGAVYCDGSGNPTSTPQHQTSIMSTIESYNRALGKPTCVNEWGRYCSSWQVWVQSHADDMVSAGVHHACIKDASYPTCSLTYTIPGSSDNLWTNVRQGSDYMYFKKLKFNGTTIVVDSSLDNSI